MKMIKTRWRLYLSACQRYSFFSFAIHLLWFNCI